MSSYRRLSQILYRFLATKFFSNFKFLLQQTELYSDRFKLKIKAICDCRRNDRQSFMYEFTWREKMSYRFIQNVQKYLITSITRTYIS